MNAGNPVSVPWPKTTTGGNGAAAAQTAVAQPKPVARSGWSLTPPVDAGETLTIQLKVRPARSPKTQHYDFRVWSRSVEGNEDTPIIDHGSVALTGAPLARQIVSWVLFGLALIMLALLAWFLLSTFGVIP